MNHVFKPVFSLVWLLSQVLTVGGLGIRYFLVPFGILVAFAFLGLLRKRADARRRLWIPILLLPVIWIAVGLCAGILWGGVSGHFRNGSWVPYLPLMGVALSLAVSIFFLIYQRGARLFVASYSIINLYITVMISFGSFMAMTGNWI